ncbi:hypothetical protein [Flavobacterium eburneipallidum]|uniref:hypothetical protein n=1 Tax=Flavobacterium eburneipallidum TaxID=3003263 RepID=UPI0022ABFDC4|nr:hypothetical protein [Flavobacterium eburneipallidum]
MSENNTQIYIKNDITISPKTLKNKWDKYLDDYKNYTQSYIKHYKKSLDGKSKSLLKYPYKKAQSEWIYQKLLNAQQKNFLTSKQLEKMYKIQIKIANPCLS